jgi:ankyrin repeat protein
MLAIANGQVEAVRALLEAGANVHVRDNFGHSAMWEAVHSRQAELIELLRQYGGPRLVADSCSPRLLHQQPTRLLAVVLPASKALVSLAWRHGARCTITTAFEHKTGV